MRPGHAAIPRRHRPARRTQISAGGAKIYQTIPTGYQGQHIQKGWGPQGEGKSNANMEGVEIIANDDADVLAIQKAAAERLVALRAAQFGYNPKTSVFGHGEVNPGHKQATEGIARPPISA
jgi:N-acetyl-anhydromuramyl-L-alanine amidase AmpD